MLLVIISYLINMTCALCGFLKKELVSCQTVFVAVLIVDSEIQLPPIQTSSGRQNKSRFLS